MSVYYLNTNQKINLLSNTYEKYPDSRKCQHITRRTAWSTFNRRVVEDNTDNYNRCFLRYKQILSRFNVNNCNITVSQIHVQGGVEIGIWIVFLIYMKIILNLKKYLKTITRILRSNRRRTVKEQHWKTV